MATRCLVIGGTGSQGAAVVRALSSSGRYTVKVSTRNASSPHARELLSPTVSLIEWSCFNEDDIVSAFDRIDLCFVHTDDFAVGEKSKIYWSIRIYDIAAFARVKHFVYGSLDYCSRKASFDPKYRCGHYGGKGKVGGQ